ncbi:MAG TPA: DUF2029 domain-containing protein [Candidatus Aminicenantes bacterium]|nr:DUF2029 domain-containing protein [Candidatus Aminicenantes bacterium]
MLKKEFSDLKMSNKTRSILLLILVFLFFSFVYQNFVKKDMVDFDVCYQGGKRIIKGEALYRVSDGHLQYKYSPASAVFFSLFTLFPNEVAKYIWYLSELIFLLLSLFISYDILPSKQKKKGLTLIFSFLVLVKFFGREIELGQINIFIFFLLIMMVKALLNKNDVKGGLFLGLSLIFKPYGLVFLPYFILKKRFKPIASGFGTVIIGLILPVIFYGLRGNIVILKEWQKTLSQSTPGLIDQYDNASIFAFFLKMMPDESRELALIFIICSGLLIAFSFLWMMILGKKENLKMPEVLEYSFLFVLIPLFSPLAWNYNYLYSLLTIVFLINYIDKFPKVLKYLLIANLIIIGGSLWEVLGKDVFRFYTGYSLVVISYLIILFYLFYLRVKIKLGQQTGVKPSKTFII